MAKKSTEQLIEQRVKELRGELAVKAVELKKMAW